MFKMLLSLAMTACLIIFVATVFNLIRQFNPAVENLTIIANPVSKSMAGADRAANVVILAASALVTWLLVEWYKHT